MGWNLKPTANLCALIEQIELMIVSGMYPPAQSCPPCGLAADAAVNPNTMRGRFPSSKRTDFCTPNGPVDDM